MSDFAFAVEKWRRWVDAANSVLDPFPTDLALKWIQMESGGNVCSVGRVDGGHVYEAGLAQTYFDSPSTVKYGVTSAQLRSKCSGTEMPTDLDDADRILQAKVALATMSDARDASRKKLSLVGVHWPETSSDFWAWVKLNHALPALQSYLSPAKRALGYEPTWQQFRAYVENLSASELAAINRGAAAYASAFPRVWANCEDFASVPASSSRRALWLAAIGIGGLLIYLHRKGQLPGLGT